MLTKPVLIASRRRPFLGQVATLCSTCNNILAGTTGFNSRTFHYARGGNIVSPQIVIGNWYVVAATGDTNPGSVKTVKASIEYPVGTYTPVTFSGGSSTAVIADGGSVISDPVPVTIPNGAFFYVKKYETNTVNVVYGDANGGCSQSDPNGGDVVNNSNVDETATTSVNGFAGVLIPPLAIVAMTTRPSIGFTGTSNVIGIGETNASPLGDQGYRRMVGPMFPYINTAVAGDSTASLLASSKRLAILDAYVTHRWLEPGPGDPAVLATVLGYLDTFNARWPKANNILGNIGPATTSTDSWATTVNQTASANEASRVATNAAFAALTGYNQFVDIAAQTTQPGSSFAVKNDGSTANLYTTDGGHWNTAMNLFLQAQGTFTPSMVR
jgi:hypothetical protein